MSRSILIANLKWVISYLQLYSNFVSICSVDAKGYYLKVLYFCVSINEIYCKFWYDCSSFEKGQLKTNLKKLYLCLDFARLLWTPF